MFTVSLHVFVRHWARSLHYPRQNSFQLCYYHGYDILPVLCIFFPFLAVFFSQHKVLDVFLLSMESLIKRNSQAQNMFGWMNTCFCNNSWDFPLISDHWILNLYKPKNHPTSSGQGKLHLVLTQCLTRCSKKATQVGSRYFLGYNEILELWTWRLIPFLTIVS